MELNCHLLGEVATLFKNLTPTLLYPYPLLLLNFFRALITI